jgi:hypothetical protein
MALPPIGNAELAKVLAANRPLQTLSSAAVSSAELEVTHSAQIGSALMTMQETAFTAPFDWMSEFQGRSDQLNDPAYLEKFDLEELRKVMTAHIRIDRMDSGHLNTLIETGYWAKAVQRLDALSSSGEGA